MLQSKVNKFLIKVVNDVGLQGNFVAMTLVCCFATLYIFALDMHIESRGAWVLFTKEKLLFLYYHCM